MHTCTFSVVNVYTVHVWDRRMEVCMTMVQCVRSVRLPVLQSVRTMALRAKVVDCDLFICVFYFILFISICFIYWDCLLKLALLFVMAFWRLPLLSIINHIIDTFEIKFTHTVPVARKVSSIKFLLPHSEILLYFKFHDDCNAFLKKLDFIFHMSPFKLTHPKMYSIRILYTYEGEC